MGKKSIYVSIPCLGFDQELTNTISTCLESSSQKNDIKIVVACIGNKDFYNLMKVTFNNIKNVNFIFYPLDNNYGIGKGRHFAAELYSKEDYFLQIDAHTLFTNNWDEILIKTFEESLIITKNPKTILTAYLPNYLKTDNQIKIQEINFLYNKWIENTFIFTALLDNTIPSWGVCLPINEYPELDQYFKYNKFMKNLKISAQFVFGNQNYANNRHLDINTLFWEEEIIQSIELIHNDFDMIYPNIKSPLYHFSVDHLSSNSRVRTAQLVEDLGITLEEYFHVIKNNFIQYMVNNKGKVRSFEAYSGISLKTASVSHEYIKI